jgi:hypothetical protein
MAARLTVEQLALVPFSFPTYANALGRAAIQAARALDLPAARAAARFPDGEEVPPSSDEVNTLERLVDTPT